MLTNPVYAGAYAFGKTRRERYIDEHGHPRKRTRQAAPGRMGGVDLGSPPRLHRPATFDANQARIRANTRARAQGSRAARSARARRCFRGSPCAAAARASSRVHYRGPARSPEPGLSLPGSILVRAAASGVCASGARRIDEAVAGALLEALTPAGVKAALAAAEALEQDHDAALSQWRLQVERARYEAERAERRYRQVEPEHRLVARGLERDWEKALGALAEAEAELSCASGSDPARSPTQSASSCWRSARTSAACGQRRPPPTATASSCCAA